MNLHKTKMTKLFNLLLLVLIFIVGCGKPNDPESIVPADISGGYKIDTIFSTPGNSRDVIKKDSLLYMAQGEGGLLIVNIKNHKKPQIVSVTTQDVRGYSEKIAIKDSVVYLSAGSFGVNVLVVADPFAPIVTYSNLPMKPANTLLVMGNYLFAATSEVGVKIAEISYPPQPDVRGGMTTSGYAQGLINSSDSSYLFVACGEMGLSVYNISDFQEGFGVYPLTGWCDTPGYAEAVVLDEAKSLAYLACGADGLQIIDYADTTNIHIIGSYYTGGYAKELIYKNQKIFITTQNKGLQIINVANPAKPTLIGQILTTYAQGIDMDENYIYVADRNQGLIIFSIPK